MSASFMLAVTLLLVIAHTAGQDTTRPASIKLTGETNKLKYDYEKVLEYSLLFYEAQRSGDLTQKKRISWRKNSCMQCGYNGYNLSGGYYTSGRSLKFTFPNAAAITVLAWGAIQHKEAYQRAGLLNQMIDALIWGADYLVQCHVGDQELVALLGDISEYEKSSWVRPEDHKGNRKILTISPGRNGSDLSGEIAAALAATSIVIREFDPSRADRYVQHSQQIFDFGDTYRGSYSNVVGDVANFYRSWQGFEDELVWAAVWLYKATNNLAYFLRAEQLYEEFFFTNRIGIKYTEFSWDDKTAGAKILMYQETMHTSNKYKEDAKWFCELTEDPDFYTKKGLFDPHKVYGTLRYASNAAFICLQLGEVLLKDKSENYTENPYLGFTLQQINYALGDTGRSYLVGFGVNWPQFIHHVGSSCPVFPGPCSIANRDSKKPNPNIMYGALAGGPAHDDTFIANVRDEVQNLVGLDVNAGFQSAVAGLLQKYYHKSLPQEAYGCSFYLHDAGRWF